MRININGVWFFCTLFLVLFLQGASVQAQQEKGEPKKDVWIVEAFPSHQRALKSTENTRAVEVKIPHKITEIPIKQSEPVFSSTPAFLAITYDEVSQPTIICKPLQECDIALEPGEVIRNMYAGDTKEWFFRKAVSGEGYKAQLHVMVRPRHAFIENSNVFITTSKRIYNLKLVADPTHYVAHTFFYYPEETKKEPPPLRVRLFPKRTKALTPVFPFIDLNKLDAHYVIHAYATGWLGPKPTWTPLRVFNTGDQHVFIEMPPVLQRGDAPVLFVVDSSGKKTLVNYRIRRNWYIVDNFFKKALMVVGVGHAQERVLITYQG
jgi:type IV secretion system protein VirB9